MCIAKTFEAAKANMDRRLVKEHEDLPTGYRMHLIPPVRQKANCSNWFRIHGRTHQLISSTTM
jgi:hypothetical protein